VQTSILLKKAPMIWQSTVQITGFSASSCAWRLVVAIAITHFVGGKPVLRIRDLILDPESRSGFTTLHPDFSLSQIRKTDVKHNTLKI